MSLTPAQNTALKNAINGSPTLSAYPNTLEGNTNMCDQQLNLNAVPAFIVWRTNVSILETGQAFDGTEWADMTAGNIARLDDIALWLAAGYDASKDDVREMFDDVWSGAGGALTRPKLLDKGLEAVYCIHCHKSTGAMTSDMPLAARHDPAPFVLCDACHEANKAIPGFLPSEVIGFGHRR